jgi:hypothetical protein
MAVSTRRRWQLIHLFAMTLKMLLLVDINNKNILLHVTHVDISEHVTHVDISEHVTHVDISEHVIPQIGDRRPAIDGGGVRIRSYRGPPLKTLETPVIALGGGQDHPRRITQGIEWNNVRVGDSWHGRVERRGREETVIGKGLTAGSSLPYQ